MGLAGKQPPKAILTENPCLTLKPNKKQGFSKGLLQKNRRKKYGQKEQSTAGVSHTKTRILQAKCLLKTLKGRPFGYMD
jgi:hypothetical protein